MENSLLEQAHKAGRDALKFLKKGEYSKSAEAHLQAAALLTDLKTRVGPESSCFNSLLNQATFHERQAYVSQTVREALGKCEIRRRKELDSQKPRTTPYRRQNMGTKQPTRSAIDASQILRNFEQADSLLQILYDRKSPAAAVSYTAPETCDVSPTQSSLQGSGGSNVPKNVLMKPKTDSVVIEELQTVNADLREHVDKLLDELREVRAELERTKRSNKILQKRLSVYEPVAEMNDSTGDPTEAEGELSAQKVKMIFESIPVRQLPELAPLELPTFDFN